MNKGLIDLRRTEAGTGDDTRLGTEGLHRCRMSLSQPHPAYEYEEQR